MNNFAICFHVQKYNDFAIVNISEIIYYVNAIFFYLIKLLSTNISILSLFIKCIFLTNFNIHRFVIFFIIEINEYDNVIDRKIFRFI